MVLKALLIASTHEAATQGCVNLVLKGCDAQALLDERDDLADILDHTLWRCACLDGVDWHSGNVRGGERACDEGEREEYAREVHLVEL